MNVNEASNLLTQYFITHDSLTNEQFVTWVNKKTPLTEVEAALSYALQDLETKGILKKFVGLNAAGATIFTWVLLKPIIFNEQLVKIDGHTAINIANLVNSFFESVGDSEAGCNPLEISEADIHILIEMIEMYANQDNEKEVEDNTKE